MVRKHFIQFLFIVLFVFGREASERNIFPYDRKKLYSPSTLLLIHLMILKMKIDTQILACKGTENFKQN